MIDLDPYDAVIFDCDGTLVDTMPGHFVIWRDTLAAHGIPLDEKRFYSLAGVSSVGTVEILAREHGVTLDAAAVALDKDRRYLARDASDAPIDEVVRVAREALRRNKKVAVASGNVTPIVHRALRGAGIADLFEVVVGADQVTHGKPAPDLFLRAASLLDALPARCVVLEDADLGLRAAAAAGMAAVDVRPWLVKS